MDVVVASVQFELASVGPRSVQESRQRKCAGLGAERVLPLILLANALTRSA